MPASAIGVSLFVIIHPVVLAGLTSICQPAVLGGAGKALQTDHIAKFCCFSIYSLWENWQAYH
jgi:hypothetical protein